MKLLFLLPVALALVVLSAARLPAVRSQAVPPVAHVCGPARPHEARCALVQRTDIHVPPAAKPSARKTATPKPTATSTATPTPAPQNCPNPFPTSSTLGPCDLVSAYKLLALPPSGTAWTWNGQTVAIVDAGDDPTAESDLAIYRQAFGLPPCTTANGCFQKVDQTGGSAFPAQASGGWYNEIAVDTDMVSAVCPMCRILLVEATTASLDDLGASVNEAATLGATAISNSYVGGDGPELPSYNHPGVMITAASGDSGYGVNYPASSQYVTGVGGTTLTRAANARGWTETAWSGSGSGCSAVIPKPAWQTDTGCSMRTVGDVAAVGDGNTPVWAYTGYQGFGWGGFGGTSVGSPIIAAVYALAGNAGSLAYGSYPYAHTGSLFDVTSGSDGTCAPAYLCTGSTGYDGPTGNGTPNGLGGF